MKYALAAMSAGLLLFQMAGCGVSPRQVEDGRFPFRSARTPYAVAICIARNARSSADGTQAEEKTLGTASWEAVVRSPAGLLAVAEVHEDGVGSVVSVRVTGSARADAKGIARRLVSGC